MITLCTLAILCVCVCVCDHGLYACVRVCCVYACMFWSSKCLVAVLLISPWLLLGGAKLAGTAFALAGSSWWPTLAWGAVDVPARNVSTNMFQTLVGLLDSDRFLSWRSMLARTILFAIRTSWSSRLLLECGGRALHLVVRLCSCTRRGMCLGGATGKPPVRSLVS